MVTPGHVLYKLRFFVITWCVVLTQINYCGSTPYKGAKKQKKGDQYGGIDDTATG